MGKIEGLAAMKYHTIYNIREKFIKCKFEQNTNGTLITFSVGSP